VNSMNKREIVASSKGSGQIQIEHNRRILNTDRIKHAATLFEDSFDTTLGMGPISKERYYSPEFHKLEVDKVWKKAWMMACWAHDIPSPGDVHVFRLADISIIIVRQKDQTLKAFYNSCRHRGRQLVDESSHVPSLRCKFHGWNWSLDGVNRYVACRDEFPQLTDDDLRLPEVRVTEWNGFIFIALDPLVPTLEEYLEDMPDQFREWDFAGRLYKAAHVEKVVPVNWKLMQEAFIEAYHVPATHPQLVGFAGEALTRYDTFPGRKHYSRSVNLAGFATNQNLEIVPSPAQAMVDNWIISYMPQYKGTPLSVVPEGGSARETIAEISRDALTKTLKVDLAKWPTGEMVDGIWYNVFPNFMIWPTLGFPLVYRFRPFGNDPEQSLMDIMIMLPFGGERPQSAPVIRQGMEATLESVLGPVGAVLDQDTANIGGLMAGVKASPKSGFTVSNYQESRIRHFHRTLDEYIAR
jgi:nitrite reductase/ring-hydroxylating ferredoxin subunit